MNNRIPPIPMMLHIIGNIPTSYAMAMSYEEQLLCLKNYLCEIVVPTMNKNIEEIQTLITYINNYFDNLDLQEEVNNKIEEMYEGGQLQEIITSYLQINGVLAFNTLNDMLNSTNIINGSTCRTLGLNTFNDGKGEYYKIRTITNDDVIDGVNIIAIPSSQTLIAELINNYHIEQIENEIEDINNEINLLTEKRYLFIGDSYNTTDTPIGGTAIVPWGTETAQYLGLNSNQYYSLGHSGTGWVRSGNTFLGLLQENISNIQHKDKITDIVVMGGINDNLADANTIYNNGILPFYNYVIEQFPNAHLHIGLLSWAKSELGRQKIRTFAQYYDIAKSLPKASVIPIPYSWYHNYSFYQSDGHPNASGSAVIGQNLANYLKSGNTINQWYSDTQNLSTAGNEMGITNETIGTITQMLSGDKVIIKIDLPGSVSLTNSDLITSANKYKIANYYPYYCYFENETPIAKGTGWAYNSTIKYFTINYTLYMKESYIYFRIDNAENVNGNTHIYPTVIAFDNLPIITLPIEFC